MEVGINPVTDPIPVAPAAHFHMGGVFTDAFGRTTIDGLWACGEITSTGAHGANRLASNSLLEAVVFAARVAEDVQRAYLEPLRTKGTIHSPSPFGRQVDVEIKKKHQKLVVELRALMDRNVGIERNGDGLVEALRVLRSLEERAGNNLTLHNLITAARIITVPALLRRESRGGHYRTDYPEPSNAFERRLKYSLTQIEAEAAQAIE